MVESAEARKPYSKLASQVAGALGVKQLFFHNTFV